MKLNELKTAAASLPRNELIELRDHVLRLSESAAEFVTGQRVKFKTRQGAFVEGTLTKINRKTMKVEAKMNEYGQKMSYPVRWTVARALVMHA